MLSPTGLARKLWLLLAYGALNHQVEQRRTEIEALHVEAENADATIGGVAGPDDSEQLLALLRDLLPDDMLARVA